ncbi:MAG: hypothetical protein AB1Z23_00865 [Eubacteriales bacterium]
MFVKISATFGSVLMMGFGVWHFTVPKVWKWYSYIDKAATELVVAVRATNVFFSLSLVLIGLANLIFIYGVKNRESMLVMFSISAFMWAVRCVMQIVYPQGSINPILQYGMLSAFIIIFASFVAPLISMIASK